MERARVPCVLLLWLCLGWKLMSSTSRWCPHERSFPGFFVFLILGRSPAAARAFFADGPLRGFGWPVSGSKFRSFPGNCDASRSYARPASPSSSHVPQLMRVRPPGARTSTRQCAAFWSHTTPRNCERRGLCRHFSFSFRAVAARSEIASLGWPTVPPPATYVPGLCLGRGFLSAFPCASCGGWVSARALEPPPAEPRSSVTM
mmetsp:Transcript_7129/g.14789  ORF Transcript_7129/g.14789 Transcript_7129/m.14789 type:complete len:203 (+) Transcript_7129:236-844(+)